MFNTPNIIIVAQNWQDFKLDAPNVQIFSYNKLGILQARKILRKHFLESDFDYMIMADDDMVMKGDPKELLEGMEKHPQGFAYCEEENGTPRLAQLNLFAISKFIYAQQPMVDVDPEKFEGWEDKIFTYLLHYKWGDYQWHFNGLTHIQGKNVKIDMERPVSTWEQNKTTNQQKKLIAGTQFYMNCITTGNYSKIPFEYEEPQNPQNPWDFPIDFVVPYVDCSDKVWQSVYRNYCYYNHMANKLKEQNGARFESHGLITYTLRCVYKFMPWIRKIHLIVSNIEQVPKGIDMSKIHVVLHKDIMPASILPTFNSSTIEMFLGNIEDLTEHFIYGNDDMMPIKPLSPPDFFTSNGLPKIDFKIVPNDIGKSNMFGKMCMNQYYMMANHFKAKIDANNFVRPDHGLAPYRKSVCLKTYQTFKRQIEAHLEPFRNEYQHQQYIYALYEFFSGTCAISQIPFKYMSTSNNIVEVRNNIISGDYAVICYNDVAIPDRSVLPERMAKFKEAIEWCLENNNN
jgi:hypothetical protein